MKKILSLFLVFAMVLSLAACGGTEESSANVPADDSEKEASIQETKKEDKPEEKITFEEIIVEDNEYCTIKITAIEPDTMWGYTLKAYLENKSADTTYMFSVQTASVNGVMADPFFASEVAPGKKANAEINLPDAELRENGITDFTDIELAFRVYDTNDWMAEDVANTSVHVYPYGEEKATTFVREAQPGDTVIVDNENVAVIVTGYEEDEIWGYVVNLYLVNKTDVPVMFSVDEVSVNGFMADPFYASSVAAGKCAFDFMYWSDTVFEENGIEAVENIEFTLRAYNEEDWSASDFVNELITLNP